MNDEWNNNDIKVYMIRETTELIGMKRKTKIPE